MRKLLSIVLILLSVNSFAQSGVKIDQVRLNELINKRVCRYNRVRTLNPFIKVSKMDSAALKTAKERTNVMAKKKKVGHFLPRGYDKFNLDPNMEEIGENALGSSQFLYKNISERKLAKFIFREFYKSKKGHKELLKLAYTESDYEVFITTHVLVNKNNHLYCSLVVTAK